MWRSLLSFAASARADSGGHGERYVPDAPGMHGPCDTVCRGAALRTPVRTLF